MAKALAIPPGKETERQIVAYNEQCDLLSARLKACDKIHTTLFDCIQRDYYAAHKKMIGCESGVKVNAFSPHYYRTSYEQHWWPKRNAGISFASPDYVNGLFVTDRRKYWPIDTTSVEGRAVLRRLSPEIIKTAKQCACAINRYIYMLREIHDPGDCELPKRFEYTSAPV